MTRRSRLERILDERLAPVAASIDDLTESVDAVRYGAVSTVAAKVADAEQRVTAATAQAAERARFDADTLAGLRAELDKRTHGQWVDHLKSLTADRDFHARSADAYLIQRDEARGQVAHLEAKVERLKIERDEARRQHDEQRRLADALLADCEAITRLAWRAVLKVPARTTRTRYLAELDKFCEGRDLPTVEAAS